ncbi:MAG: glycerol acyltransferase [Rhodothermales bacterium]|nr:glycerol acyltransferase [Rhodothermales bacterium]
MVRPVDITRSPDAPTDEIRSLPQRGSGVLQWLGTFVLKIMRWRIDNTLPSIPKAVVIVAPHTSNWDFVLGLAAALALDVDAHWIGKHTIFRWPFGRLMRWLGGIPVNRQATSGFVEQVVERFNQSDQLVLGIAPEGTRRKVQRWKSGFYHIAAGAKIPIVCAYLDYQSRVVGLGLNLMPTGNFETDLAVIQDFYAPYKGKRSSD